MSVDVGSAVGYLDLDINGFLSGLRTAQSEASSASADIGKSISGVGDSMSKIGGFATAGITTPIVTAVTASVQQFSKLEQSIGGVETLFKDSAGIVIKNAEKAYKTAGVDANAYMEQVTSFSATLLQGLGGDTTKAAKAADKAIVDMSDNANKMGTDIGLIQNAYQGFAKDNYTMLDNLKLGYGGTAGEMARLVNESGVMGDSFEATADNVKDIPFDMLIDAIHVTQDNLGITGTTAKEASETVGGSFETMKSSVLNFLQQLGNPGADMDAFAKAMVDSIGVFVSNVKRVLLTIWDNLPISPLQKKLIVAAAAFGPVMLAAGKVVSIVGGAVTAFGKISSVFAKLALAATAAGTATTGAGTAAAGAGAGFSAMLGPILAIVAIVAVLVAAFVNLWKTNEDFRNKMTAIWDGIKAKFEGFTQGIVDRLNALGFNFKDITEVIKAVWEGFCAILAPVFEGAFSVISAVLGTVFDVITGILDVFIGLFTGNWEQMWTGVKEIFGGLWDGIVGIFTAVIDTIIGIGSTILGWFGTTWNGLWQGICDFFSNLWQGIVDFFTGIGNTIVTTASNLVNGVVTFFSELPGKIATFIGNVLTSIGTWAINMVNKAREMGTNFINSVVEFFTQLPYKIGYFIGSALGNIILWVTNMVAKAREMGTNFINAVVSFFTQLPGKILNFITSAINNVTTWATNMATKAREMGTNFINNVVSFFTQLPGKILNFITSAINNVTTWVTNMGNKAREAGTTFLSNVVTFMTQLPGKIQQFLTSAINNLQTWVTNMGSKGKEAVTSLINNVVQAAKDIPSKVMSIGSDIVSGVWKGICNAKDAFVNNVKGFFSGIVDGVKDALGIGSPSKVFAKQVGQWLPPGVTQGFKAAMPKAMSELEGSLNDGIDNLETDDVEVGTVKTFATSMKSIYSDMALYFESVESRIRDSINNMSAMLRSLIEQGQVIVNGDGTLGYVGYGGFTKTPKGGGGTDGTPRRPGNYGDGDTFNFYSPKAIDEVEAARQMKKTKQEIAEGF